MVLQELSLHLGELGVLVGMVVLRFPAIHQSVQGFANAVGKSGLPPLLAAFPQKRQKQDRQSQTGGRGIENHGRELQQSRQNQKRRRQGQEEGYGVVPSHARAPNQT